MSNPQPEKVRVVVGDDHPLFREGVVRALSLSGSVNVVGEADDGAAALELIKAHLPDVALLDYRMPGMDGAQVAAAVRSYELPTRVLLISAHDEPAIVYQALQQAPPDSCSGFDSHRDRQGGARLREGPRRGGALAGRGPRREIRQRAAPVAPVLAREREVLNRIACGQSIPAIAAELYVAPSTVKTHVQRLYEKLGVATELPRSPRRCGRGCSTSWGRGATACTDRVVRGQRTSRPQNRVFGCWCQPDVGRLIGPPPLGRALALANATASATCWHAARSCSSSRPRVVPAAISRLLAKISGSRNCSDPARSR